MQRQTKLFLCLPALLSSLIRHLKGHRWRTLSIGGFAESWNYTTALLEPQIVSSLNNARFVQLSPGQRPPLHDIFEQLFEVLGDKNLATSVVNG